MQLIRVLHQVIYFIVELGMLASLSYAGFHSSQQSYKNYLLGIGLPLSAALLWGLFAAPRSAYRLALPYRSIVALFLFGLAAFLLYRVDQPRLSILFGIIALVSELIALHLQD